MDRGSSAESSREFGRSESFLLFGSPDTEGTVRRGKAGARPEREAERVVSGCSQNRSVVSGSKSRENEISLSCSAGENRRFEINVGCTNPEITRYRLPLLVRRSILRCDAEAAARIPAVANRTVAEVMNCIMEDNAIDAGAGIAGAID